MQLFLYKLLNPELVEFELSLTGQREQMRRAWTCRDRVSKSDFHAKGECGIIRQVRGTTDGLCGVGHLLGGGCTEKWGRGSRQGLQHPEGLLPSVLMSLGLTLEAVRRRWRTGSRGVMPDYYYELASGLTRDIELFTVYFSLWTNVIKATINTSWRATRYYYRYWMKHFIYPWYLI